MAQRGIEDYMDVEGHIDPDVQRNVSSLITAVSLSLFNSIKDVRSNVIYSLEALVPTKKEPMSSVTRLWPV